ncbi:MAG: hypothetical protein Q9220_007567 [cf. Caloplaca sp. 1 TL-2023]
MASTWLQNEAPLNKLENCFGHLPATPTSLLISTSFNQPMHAEIARVIGRPGGLGSLIEKRQALTDIVQPLHANITRILAKAAPLRARDRGEQSDIAYIPEVQLVLNSSAETISRIDKSIDFYTEEEDWLNIHIHILKGKIDDKRMTPAIDFAVRAHSVFARLLRIPFGDPVKDYMEPLESYEKSKVEAEELLSLLLDESQSLTDMKALLESVLKGFKLSARCLEHKRVQGPSHDQRVLPWSTREAKSEL